MLVKSAAVAVSSAMVNVQGNENTVGLVGTEKDQYLAEGKLQSIAFKASFNVGLWAYDDDSSGVTITDVAKGQEHLPIEGNQMTPLWYDGERPERPGKESSDKSSSDKGDKGGTNVETHVASGNKAEINITVKELNIFKAPSCSLNKEK